MGQKVMKGIIIDVNDDKCGLPSAVSALGMHLA